MSPLIFLTIESKSDKSKMEQIWEKYQGLMLYVSKNILHDHGLAEDAVSEACIKIIRNLHKINEISCNQTKSYIVSIVRSTSIDIIRKVKNNRESSDEILEFIPNSGVDALEDLITEEGYTNLKKAIKTLPDHMRDIIYLSLVHGHSHEEISQILGINPNTSKTRLHRAKKEIRKRLAGEHYDNQ